MGRDAECEGSIAAGSAAGGSRAAGMAVLAEVIGEAPKGSGSMAVVETDVGANAGDGMAEGNADGSADGSKEAKTEEAGDESELRVIRLEDGGIMVDSGEESKS
mmetsp:Transcript_85886/g.171516  ORF Transcript_85886/g.171516 Transcript_85886/m.171516 type:complete len:104 (-) Transcript_85886:925-1236(-)